MCLSHLPAKTCDLRIFLRVLTRCSRLVYVVLDVLENCRITDSCSS
jgi:hypothetical protein